MGQPRIVLILPSFAGGGAERVAVTLARHLLDLAAEVHMVVLDATGPLATSVPSGVQIHDLGHRRLRTALPSLVRKLRSLAPATVLSTIGYINMAVAGIRPLLPSTIRILLREANLPSLSLANVRGGFLLRLGCRLFYPLADKILCSSTAMRQEVCRDFGVDKDNAVFVPNPVDIEAIRNRATAPRRRPGGGLRLVTSGRLVHQKGMDRLIGLMSGLPEPTTLTILGDGPDRVRLADEIASRGLAARVEFAGFVSNPWSYYAGADALLIASRWEGMPNAALEALACGTPVIATPETGGLAELCPELPLGSLIIAEFGPAFHQAVLSSPLNHETILRPSLLPDRFRAAVVAQTILRLAA